MLKKVLFLFFALFTLAIASGGYLIFQRFSRNPQQITPYPYRFSGPAASLKLDAPILIVGDRMGEYFAKFKEHLALSISVGLSTPIKIQSSARSGHALHRTLHELRSLTQWPQIVIYQGGSEEFNEPKFELESIPKIKKNFSLYRDDRIETAVILWPWLSRIIYEPLKRTELPPTPQPAGPPSEEDYLKRMDTEFMLYEQQLIQLVNMSKDRSTLLILTTTPLNLDIPPKKVCEFTSNMDLEKEIFDIKEMLKANNPKNAYARSSKLLEKYSGNALLFYIHGQTARRVGLLDDARKTLREATAFDCGSWRASEVQNAIIRKVANEQQTILFDFALLLEKDYSLNTTFFDEIYPQNLYYEKGSEQLGMVIKAILKL